MSLKTVSSGLTRTQLKILACVNMCGGELKSLNKLTRAIGINYSWAWSLVQRLEAGGQLRITRTGRDMVISTVHEPGPPND